MNTGTRLAVLLSLAVAVLAPAAVSAQGGGRAAMVETHVNPKTRGADANVKQDSAANVMGHKIAAPAAKGGVKTRGAAMSGQLHVDNRTDLIIRIYVNGDFVGTVSPWGDSYGYYDCGISVYARAYFTDGSFQSWGPVPANVCDGGFTWRLWP
ncbi:MAG: hypothetical protein ACREL5_03390 [Gemmatimonadales bacterium]